MLQVDPEVMIAGYRQRNFLMDDDEVLGWYSSQQQTLMPLDDRFRYLRSLYRILNQNSFLDLLYQIINPHRERFRVYTLLEVDYQRQLQTAIQRPRTFQMS